MVDLDKKAKLYTIKGAGYETYIRRFTNADLVAGVLTVDHKLDQKYPVVVVYDNTDKVILPDEVTSITEDRVTVDLSSLGVLTGVYTVRVIGG